MLGGVAGALTCADVFAAQKSPLARIGILSIFPLTECKSFPDTLGCLLAPELRALGWREGENLQSSGASPMATLLASLGGRPNLFRCGLMS